MLLDNEESNFQTSLCGRHCPDGSKTVHQLLENKAMQVEEAVLY